MSIIAPLTDRFRPQVNERINTEWGGPVVVTKGAAHDTSGSDGFIAVDDGELTGYILYAINGKECEILVLESLKQNHGIGTALIDAVKSTAAKQGCSRIWLVTTNDNIHAIRYYQRHGFELTAVHIDAIQKSRELKPSIPLIGDNGIPIKHEFEFSLMICKGSNP